MCDIYALIGSLCGGASIWTMTAIAYDRYNVIVKVRKRVKRVKRVDLLFFNFRKMNKNICFYFVGNVGNTTDDT